MERGVYGAFLPPLFLSLSSHSHTHSLTPCLSGVVVFGGCAWFCFCWLAGWFLLFSHACRLYNILFILFYRLYISIPFCTQRSEWRWPISVCASAIHGYSLCACKVRRKTSSSCQESIHEIPNNKDLFDVWDALSLSYI